MAFVPKYQAVRDTAWSEHCYPRTAVGDFAEPSARFKRVVRVYEDELAAKDREIARLTALLEGRQ